MTRRACLFGAFSTWAQDATFSTDVKVVSLLATVRDKQGQVVKDLNRDDFLLQEDGTPQTIRYFRRESDLPLTLGLLVDTSRSQITVLNRERKASSTFLNKMLRPEVDKAFVVSFDEQVKVLKGLTSSKKELGSALRSLRIPPIAATLIYQAVRQTSEDFMMKLRGRKALILLTDGNAYLDPTTIDPAIESAQRADTLIYGVRFFGYHQTYPGVLDMRQVAAAENGKNVLLRMAAETGGEEYEVTRDHPIEKVFQEIEEALRNLYSIGYTPNRIGASGTYHKVNLTVSDRNLTVRTRDGYYLR
jgi:VWFA-related protein